MENKKSIAVSVIMFVYNHENYLRKALNGVVNQKTNFSFEIVVHDDASTDKSQEIIREYIGKYPELFVPILQEENQLSKNPLFDLDIIYPRCIGKYFAYCEGDDFWSDPNKLQIQYDLLEKNSNCSICVHKVGSVKEDGTILKRSYPAKNIVNHEDKILKSREVVAFHGLYPFQTSSYFIKKSVLDPMVQRRSKMVGILNPDEIMMYMALMKGDLYYCDKVMSYYRRGVPGSWTTTLKKEKVPCKIDFLKRSIRGQVIFDYESGYLFHDILQGKILSANLSISQYSINEANKLLNENKEYYQEPVLSIKQRIQYNIYKASPLFYSYLAKISQFRRSWKQKMEIRA
ncbi:glycosyltransferase family 2 protein [Enterococcus pseudoavium]|uniref:glycosyltransferase family 2 protein n=1 Tax=Enterococcus pseudoavium TaxID=44007 RepID=UPI0008344E3A|nr:glycosyltransferase [Enterococcus pseudoavium]REC32398.1 hypothetical protein CF160_08015 [Enterococcus pseudoavium]